MLFRAAGVPHGGGCGSGGTAPLRATEPPRPPGAAPGRVLPAPGVADRNAMREKERGQENAARRACSFVRIFRAISWHQVRIVMLGNYITQALCMTSCQACALGSWGAEPVAKMDLKRGQSSSAAPGLSAEQGEPSPPHSGSPAFGYSESLLSVILSMPHAHFGVLLPSCCTA